MRFIAIYTYNRPNKALQLIIADVVRAGRQHYAVDIRDRAEHKAAEVREVVNVWEEADTKGHNDDDDQANQIAPRVLCNLSGR